MFGWTADEATSFSIMDAFIAGVLEGRPLSPSGEDGFKAQLLADAATQAARDGRAVSLA